MFPFLNTPYHTRGNDNRTPNAIQGGTGGYVTKAERIGAAAAAALLDDWRLRPTVTVEQTGEILGIGRNSAYDAVTAGTIPSIRVGRRIVVPVAQLRRLLGETV